jgi:K+/H+ antiporter YhaU regulatory subunit KhtT
MFVLVLASVFAHTNSIYRAQRDSFERGQILPGVSVRRIRVPSAWAGQDLLSLGIRERFGLTVIGMVDRREAADGTLDERVVLNPAPTQTLSRGDMLIVLGEDDRIERFSKASAAATATGLSAYDPTAPT